MRLLRSSVCTRTIRRLGNKVREHLRVESMQMSKRVQNAGGILISFEYGDRFLAQKVVQDVGSRMIDGSILKPVIDQAGMTLEMLDPATLPYNPFYPNRAMVAGVGLSIGLGCAVLLGLWRMFGKRPP